MMMMTIVVIEVVVVELLRDEIRSFERRLVKGEDEELRTTGRSG